MKILDCTLRDGGYYNNWDFDPVIVSEYLRSIALSNVEYVELGLRNFPKNGFLGAFAYTTEAFLDTLDLPNGPTYGVMIDAKTILSSDLPVDTAIDKLFEPANESKIGLVRVAAHFAEVEHSGAIINKLKQLGYIVGFNLMQSGGKPEKLIKQKALQAKSWEGLDVLYFADSLGNMDAQEVERIVGILKSVWGGPLGIHTHDNMGKGLDNTLIALNAGVTWLDSTITGMGRGAGNTQTERLLATLSKTVSKYNPKPVYELVIRHFEPLQKQYGWGSGLLYFLGAQNDVHPTYLQNLLSNTHFGTDEVIGAIDYLSELEGSTSYNDAVLDTALNVTDNHAAVTGTHDIDNLFNGKDVLIITNGESAKKHATAITHYINVVKPVTISINITDFLDHQLINFYAISHNSKFLSEGQDYKRLDRPVILPKHKFTQAELSELSDVTLIDYGLQVSKGALTANGKHAVIPYDITIAYVLAAILRSTPKSVSAVGLDGYDTNDIRQQEMLKILSLYEQCSESKPLTSLTPSSYPINKGSIYAPII